MLTLNVLPTASPGRSVPLTPPVPRIIPIIDQTWSVKRIALEAPPLTYEKIFADAKDELEDVSGILDKEEKLYGTFIPRRENIFAAFNYTPFDQIKAVIVGQDPYHQTIQIKGSSTPRAVGLSFSVHPDDVVPSSLQNIYKELVNTVHGFTMPDHGDLREWAQQGVLLLNMCLTVRPGQAGSHGEIWLGFIKKLLKAIAIKNSNCIFVLWGREAQKIREYLGDKSVVLEAAHPSGLSAYRGFFGCNHFNIINQTLIRQGKVGINWKINRRDGGRPSQTPHPRQPQNFVPVTVNAFGMIPGSVPAVPSYGSGNVPLIIGKIPCTPLGSTSLLPTIPNVRDVPSPRTVQIPKELSSPRKHSSDQTIDVSVDLGRPIIPQITFDIGLVKTFSTKEIPILLSNIKEK